MHVPTTIQSPNYYYVVYLLFLLHVLNNFVSQFVHLASNKWVPII